MAALGTTVLAVNETYFAPSIEDPDINMTCTDVPVAADGQPAILLTAVLDVPAAETYESIGIKYLFEDFETFFEDVTAEEAEAGLFVEFSDEGTRVIGPDGTDALQLTE